MVKQPNKIKIETFIDYLKEQLHTDERGVLIKLIQLESMDNAIEDQLLEGGDDAIIKVPKPLQMIIYCTSILGWGFIIKQSKEELNGFIIGNNEYLKDFKPLKEE